MVALCHMPKQARYSDQDSADVDNVASVTSLRRLAILAAELVFQTIVLNKLLALHLANGYWWNQ